MLLLDIGNTRIKYRVDDGPVTAIAHDGDPDSALARVARGAAHLAVVDVTGAAARSLAGRDARILTPTATACGVVNAYPEPARLGADRWAALIGAHSLAPRACCVIDAGSAITADVLTADGRHLGGWIAPGIGLAIDALARGTRHARSASAGAAGSAPATDTADAIRRGAALALAGFAVRALEAAARALGDDPDVLVCGGDAAVVADAVGGRIVDDLVLCGLAVWVGGR